jgi:hypothetical protein
MTSADPEHKTPESRLDQTETAATPKAGWFEQFLPRGQSKAVFIFATLCYSFTVTDIEARLIRVFGLWPVRVDPVRHVLRPVRPGVDNSNIIDLLLISPVIESFIMIGIIELLRRLKFNIVIQVMTSVSLLCLLHGMLYPFYAFLVAPTFLIYAGTYVYWRRISFWVGAEMIILLHFFSNAMPFLSVVAEWLHR